MPDYLLPFWSGLMLSLALTPLSRRLAFRIGAIDQPSERRIHVVATPRLGGPAIFLALVGATALASWLDRVSIAASGLAWPALGALMITVLGTVDDIRPLRPGTKLLVEIVAATLAVCGGCGLSLPTIYHLNLLSFPLSAFLIISVVNAVNLVDGLDGLAVGLCLIISVTLFLLSGSQGPTPLMLAASCGVTAGFLCYNFHPARIFLGDSGALLLGYLVAIGAISVAHGSRGAPMNFAPLLALGMPLAELTLTVVRRVARVMQLEVRNTDARHYRWSIAARAALFSADRDHIHHRLLARGFSHRSAVLMLYGAGAIICTAAFALGTRAGLPRGLLLAAIILSSASCARGLNYRELMPLRAGLWLPALEMGASSRQAFWLVTDIGAVACSLALALFIPFGSNHLRDHFYSIWLPLLGAIQVAAFWSAGLYRRRWRHAGVDDVLAVLRAIAVAMAAEAAVVVAAPSVGLSFTTFVLDGYLLTTMVLGARLSFPLAEHLFQRERREGRRVLIYGAGRAGTLALNEMRVKSALGMTAVGFLDDDPRKCGSRLRGIAIHRLSEVPHLIRGDAFDLIAISSRKITAARERMVVEQCERAGLEVIRFGIAWSGPIARLAIERSPVSRADATDVALDVAGATP